MNISIEYENIKKAALAMLETADNIDAKIKQILIEIESINNIWQGQDALKYVNIMKERYIVGLQELKDIMVQYSYYLNGVVLAYSTLDEVFANKNIEV